MTHDRCGETTILYDTGLHDVKSSSPDVEQVEIADETIPNTGHLDDEDDKHSRREANQVDSGGMSDCLDDSMTSWWGTSSRTGHYTARHWWQWRSLDPQPRLWLTLTGKQRCSESTILWWRTRCGLWFHGQRSDSRSLGSSTLRWKSTRTAKW